MVEFSKYQNDGLIRIEDRYLYQLIDILATQKKARHSQKLRLLASNGTSKNMSACHECVGMHG